MIAFVHVLVDIQFVILRGRILLHQHIIVTVETSHVLMASDRNQTCGE